MSKNNSSPFYILLGIGIILSCYCIPPTETATLFLENIRQLHRSIFIFQKCLTNMQIPLGGKCDEAKALTLENNLRTSNGVLEGRDLFHSRKIKLADHVELAKLKCRQSFTGCSKEGVCSCLFTGCERDLEQIKVTTSKSPNPSTTSTTCEMEYKDLLEKLDAAKINDNSPVSKDNDLPPIKIQQETFQEYDKYYYDYQIDPKVSPGNISQELRSKRKPIYTDRHNRNPFDSEDFQQEEKDLSVDERLERRRAKNLKETRAALDACLENFQIPIGGECSRRSEFDEEEFYVQKLVESEGDFGKISLRERIELESVNCLRPSFCDGSKCVCFAGSCVGREQNKGTSCSQQFSTYLEAAVNAGLNVTIVPNTEPLNADFRLPIDDGGRILKAEHALCLTLLIVISLIYAGS